MLKNQNKVTYNALHNDNNLHFIIYYSILLILIHGKIQQRRRKSRR